MNLPFVVRPCRSGVGRFLSYMLCIYVISLKDGRPGFWGFMSCLYSKRSFPGRGVRNLQPDPDVQSFSIKVRKVLISDLNTLTVSTIHRPTLGIHSEYFKQSTRFQVILAPTRHNPFIRCSTCDEITCRQIFCATQNNTSLEAVIIELTAHIKSLPSQGENHQNKISLSSGLIVCFALE